MMVLCIGGANDGKIVDIDPRKGDGETHALTYRVNLAAEGVDGDCPFPEYTDIDYSIMIRSEIYQVRRIYFSRDDYATVLYHGRRHVTIREIFQALIDGYGKSKVTPT